MKNTSLRQLFWNKYLAGFTYAKLCSHSATERFLPSKSTLGLHLAIIKSAGAYWSLWKLILGRKPQPQNTQQHKKKNHLQNPHSPEQAMDPAGNHLSHSAATGWNHAAKGWGKISLRHDLNSAKINHDTEDILCLTAVPILISKLPRQHKWILKWMQMDQVGLKCTLSIDPHLE